MDHKGKNQSKCVHDLTYYTKDLTFKEAKSAL